MTGSCGTTLSIARTCRCSGGRGSSRRPCESSTASSPVSARFLVFLACQGDQGNLAFLVDQVRLYHPSFQWLQFHQQDPVNLDLQGFLIHQVVQEGQQYLVDLFLLVCQVDLQDQVFQCCLFLPCVQQVQATLSFLAIQQDLGVLYVLVPL